MILPNASLLLSPCKSRYRTNDIALCHACILKPEYFTPARNRFRIRRKHPPNDFHPVVLTKESEVRSCKPAKQ